jgi:hypothetical protein
LSFDTRLAQDATAEPSGILLRVNRDPHFLAGDGVLQQRVAAPARPNLANPAAFSSRITSAQVTHES